MHTPFDPRVWPMHSKPHVLIVDDAPKRQDNLYQRLSPQWLIETAETAPDALRLLRSQHFDLMLIDIRCLEIDGNQFGLLHHIRGDIYLRRLGVILITDQAHEATLIDALIAGADDYINAPFSPGDVVTRLKARLALIQRQKTALQEPATRKKRAEDILESISELFCAIDENFRFNDVNQKTEKTGPQHKDRPGKFYWAELPDAVGSESSCIHLKVMAERHSQEYEFLSVVAHLCTQALERVWVYETEKEAREIAEKTNQVKMRFLAMISHELLTPLASIKGFTSTLLATDVTFTPEEYQDFLGVVDQETDKLTDLVVQLLDLTRLQAGTLHIEMSPHTLQKVIQIAQAQLMTLAKHHRLVIQIPDDLSAVLIDPQRLSQVMVNLVDNAAKFSPEQTSITLRAFQNHDSIQIDVSDEGIGIPLENRIEVFEVFQQVKKAAPHDPGAGLGLAICKGIIEAHGGHIWVQDHESGTTISLVLRIATQEQSL